MSPKMSTVFSTLPLPLAVTTRRNVHTRVATLLERMNMLILFQAFRVLHPLSSRQTRGASDVSYWRVFSLNAKKRFELFKFKNE